VITLREQIDGLSTSQKSLRCEDPISVLEAGTVTPLDSPVFINAETQTQIGSRNTVPSSHLRSSGSNSASTMRALSPSNELPRQFEFSLRSTSNTTTSYVPLKKGQRIWRELSPASGDVKVSTPRIRLTISHDETPCRQQPRGSSQDPVVCRGRYWVILEFLPDNAVPQDRNVPIVSLCDVPGGWERTLNYDDADWPKELCVCSRGDTVSVTYSLLRPADGMDDLF